MRPWTITWTITRTITDVLQVETLLRSHPEEVKGLRSRRSTRSTDLLASWLLGFIPGFTDLPLIARVLLATLLLTPVMTYAVLPWVTRMLRPWLQRGA